MPEYVTCRKCGSLWRGKAEEFPLCPNCGSCHLKGTDTDWLNQDRGDENELGEDCDVLRPVGRFVRVRG
jgi:hypothetical protein